MVPGANPEKRTMLRVAECATAAASSAQIKTNVTNNAARLMIV